MRLDKLFSQATSFTRSQAKNHIKKGRVTVDGMVVTNPAQHIAETASVAYMNVPLSRAKPRYIMFNKPAGVVCANKDKDHPTVFDALFVPRVETLHVAGRLDIDTTGLVLITDDGQWLHRITSPKHHHKKTYLVDLASEITDRQIRILTEGVQLKAEKERCKPASVEVLQKQKIRLTISEGKYHQVKRMLAAVANHVVKLHREKIANIRLDSDLAEGQWRDLKPGEIDQV